MERVIGRASAVGSRSKGDAQVALGRRWADSQWIYRLELGDEVSYGVEGLSVALASLEDDMVKNIISLGDACDVVVEVIQFVDELEHLGMALDRAAIEMVWRLGAMIDIGQYSGQH